MKFNAWELEQIRVALIERTRYVRQQAMEICRITKDGSAGENLQTVARHIDAIIEKIEKGK